MTKIIHINPIKPEEARVEAAARIIREGGTVAFPTETVYGLGANCFDVDACRRIFEIKGRPPDNPLIIHIPKAGWLDRVARAYDVKTVRFIEKVWPGPVTLVLKRNPAVPDIVTGGIDTAAIRCPAHKIAISLIERSGVPIAAPSANLSTKPSITKFEHAVLDLDGKADAIIDGGDAIFGIESTVINMTVEPHAILRPGVFTVEELKRHFGKISIPGRALQTAERKVPLAPGMKYRHYAPDKKLIMAKSKLLLKKIALHDFELKEQIAILCSNETATMLQNNTKLKHIFLIPMGSEKDLYEVARNLFNAFRALDDTHAAFGIIQKFEERGIGLAIMNRISKATEESVFGSIDQINDLLNKSKNYRTA